MAPTVLLFTLPNGRSKLCILHLYIFVYILIYLYLRHLLNHMEALLLSVADKYFG